MFSCIGRSKSYRFWIPTNEQGAASEWGAAPFFGSKKFFKKTFKMLLTKGGFSRIINIVVREQTKAKNKICGCSSSGRAPPCQGGGSEFEPRHPLQVLRQSRNRLSFFCCVCKSGIENPRRFRLRGFSYRYYISWLDGLQILFSVDTLPQTCYNIRIKPYRACTESGFF